MTLKTAVGFAILIIGILGISTVAIRMSQKDVETPEHNSELTKAERETYQHLLELQEEIAEAKRLLKEAIADYEDTLANQTGPENRATRAKRRKIKKYIKDAKKRIAELDKEVTEAIAYYKKRLASQTEIKTASDDKPDEDALSPSADTLKEPPSSEPEPFE